MEEFSPINQEDPYQAHQAPGAPSPEAAAQDPYAEAMAKLTEIGLADIAGDELTDHQGNKMSVLETIVACEWAFPAIQSANNMARSMGQENTVQPVRNFLRDLKIERHDPSPTKEQDRTASRQETTDSTDRPVLPESAKPVIREVISRTRQVSDAIEESRHNHPSNPPQASGDALRFSAQELIHPQAVLEHAQEQVKTATLVMDRPVTEAANTAKVVIKPQATSIAIAAKPKLENLGDKDAKVLLTAFEPNTASSVDSFVEAEKSADDMAFGLDEEPELLEAAISDTDLASLLEASSETKADINEVAEKEVVPAARAITAKVTEMVQLPEARAEEIVGQVQAFNESMHVIVAEQIDTFMETAEPEEVAAVAETIVVLAAVADRLNVLFQENKLDSEEAQQIELYIRQQYEQLLLIVGLEPDDILIEAFIQTIKSDQYGLPAETPAEAEFKNDMHERLQGLLGNSGDGFNLTDALRPVALGAYILQLSARQSLN